MNSRCLVLENERLHENFDRDFELDAPLLILKYDHEGLIKTLRVLSVFSHPIYYMSSQADVPPISFQKSVISGNLNTTLVNLFLSGVS